jgi:ribosome recycling factor
MQDILNATDTAMRRAVDSLEKDLGTINTGRATPSLLDTVMVECYGSYTQLSKMASITAPDPLTLVVQPWDKSLLSATEKAIMAANLGFSPSPEGGLLRISIPKLSEERRKELCKVAKKYGEDRKVTVRNIRKDSLDKIKKSKNGVSEDLVKDTEKKVQETTDKYVKEIDGLVAQKEKNLLTF